MGLEKRTVKIIVIVVVAVLLIGGILGLLLGLLLPRPYVELEVWPRSEEYKWDQPLIEFRINDPGSYAPWVKRINDFLRAYESAVPTENAPRAPCSTHHRQEVTRSAACDTAMQRWEPCTIDHYYGYRAGTPCVFLRLDHIHYWVPEPYNLTTSLSIPQEMPDNLKRALRQFSTYEFGDFVWVSCEGEFSADQENIGPIQYIPAGGPPGFSMRRLHTADRIPLVARSLPEQDPGPLIAVFFENPRRGVLINVECRIWTRDIYYDRSSRIGRARFELYIE